MAYEIFTKMTRMDSDPRMSIGKKLGRLQFNSTAAKILEEKAVQQVLVMWDREKRTMAVRGIAKKDPRAYSMRFAKKGNGAGFAAKAFLQFIGYDLTVSRAFDCHWNDEQNMFEIALPEDAFKAEPRGRTAIRPMRLDVESRGHAKASS